MNYPTDRIVHTTAFVTPVVEHWLKLEIALCVHHEGLIRRPITHHEQMLYQRAKSRSLGCCGGHRNPQQVGLISRYFSFQPVLHDWCKKGHGMCYPVCGMMHIKKSSPCGGNGFLLSLSEWSFTICLRPYNRK